MRYRIEEPLFTQVLPNVNSFRPQNGSLYITGTSVEERSKHTEEWEADCMDVTFARVAEKDRSAICVAVEGEPAVDVALRSNSALEALLASRRQTATYLDITGLSHHVWAPLLRAMRSRPEPSFGVYVEPGDYRFSTTPTEVTLFDLSERIGGIEPLPGFVSFGRRVVDPAIFVPLLGFEGTRLTFMLEEVQPQREEIYPIVGMPGFRPEYLYYTYQGNKVPLIQTKAWRNIRFAAANCPFSVYHVIGAVAEGCRGKKIKIGLIGTKPHALGGVLYHIDHPNDTELLHDFPVRSPDRTTGKSRVCLYDFSLLPLLRPLRGGS